MSERIANGRKKLHNYSALDGLNDFLEKIAADARGFDIVSATERRCYNIVARFLSPLNIVSNNALLLMYEELAEAYSKTGALPRILIIDDIMIHGRGLSRFLLQLEAVIMNELKHRGRMNSYADYISFSMQFTNSVTIYIYAKNSGALLLAPRFLSRIDPWEEMHVGKLRNLSMQLSDCLSRWDIANTSFAYSIRSLDLAKAIRDLFTNAFAIETESLYEIVARIYNLSSKSTTELTSNWFPIIWKYNDEAMYLFIRLYGKGKIERISTIRLFPERDFKEEPLITSYTLFGDVSIDVLDSVCTNIADRLSDFKSIKKVLENRNRQLSDIKGQLLTTLISIVDFKDFCNTTFGRFYPYHEHMPNDLKKIALNYSKSPLFYDELLAIAKSEIAQASLGQVFAEHLYDYISPLINIDVSNCNQLRLSPYDISRINQQINLYTNRSVYHLGAEAEVGARVYTWGIEESQRDAHTELDLSHGVVPIRICAEDMKRHFDEKAFAAESVFCHIASLISVMDNGVISVRQAREGNDLVSMVKAGEMAVFHIPSKFSLFIPAFVEIEEKYYGHSGKLIEQIVGFVKKYLESEEARNGISSLVAEKDGKPLPQVKKIVNQSFRETFGNKERYVADLHRFYGIGHNFRGWNFLNLTYQNDSILSTFQTILCDLAKNSK